MNPMFDRLVNSVRRGRAIRLVFRTALAAVFGIMSLLHGPVMAFAHAAHAAAMIESQITAPGDDHHHHRADGVGDIGISTGMDHTAGHRMAHGAADGMASPSSPPAPPDDADCKILCYGIGCFQSMAPPACDAPPLQSLLIERLVPAAARGMQPAPPDPDHPPPRLRS
jgi:uncharacterized protein involved in copper resistance